MPIITDRSVPHPEYTSGFGMYSSRSKVLRCCPAAAGQHLKNNWYDTKRMLSFLIANNQNGRFYRLKRRQFETTFQVNIFR